MSLLESVGSEELILNPRGNDEHLLDLLRSFLNSLGIILKRYNNFIFVHFNFKSSRKFVQHTIKSVGSISLRVLEIIENEHVMMANVVFEELLGKSRLFDLKKELKIIIGGLFVASKNKILSKFAHLIGDSGYYIGFPKSIIDIPEYTKILDQKRANNLIDKIIRISTTYLLIHANEFFLSKKDESSRKAFLILWDGEIKEELLETIETTILNML